MTKREYEYIRYRKTFTNHNFVRAIKELASDWLIDDNKVLDRLIEDAAAKAIQSKRNLSMNILKGL